MAKQTGLLDQKKKKKGKGEKRRGGRKPKEISFIFDALSLSLSLSLSNYMKSGGMATSILQEGFKEKVGIQTSISSLTLEHLY